MNLHSVLTRCFILGFVFFCTTNSTHGCMAALAGTTGAFQDDEQPPKTYVGFSQQRSTLIDKFNESLKDGVQVQIAALNRVVHVEKAMIEGLESGDPAFVAGVDTDPKELLAELLEQAISTSEALGERLQKSRMYDDGIAQVQYAIVLSTKRYGNEDWRTRRMVLDLALAQWLAGAEENQLKKWDAANALVTQGFEGFRNRDWPTAIGNYRKAKIVFEELHLQGTEPYGRAVSNLAEFLAKSGDLKNAETAYLESIKINDALFLKRNPTNAAMRTTFAILYEKTGRPEKAIVLLKEGDEILKIALGEHSMQLANNLYARGIIYRKQERTQEAGAANFEALQMLIALGERDSAMALNVLGELYQVMTLGNHHEVAATLSLAANDVAVGLFGEGSEENVKWLMLAAKSLQVDGKYAQSVKHYSKAKAILEKQPQFESDDNYITCLGMLATSQYSMRNSDEAIELSAKAMELARNIDATSMLYLTRAQNLAYLYTMSKKHEEAETLFAQIMPILKQKLGEDHEEYRRIMVDRGVNLILNEQWNESIKVWLAIKKLQEQQLGKSHSDHYLTLKYLLKAYENLGDVESAAKTKQEMSRIKPPK